MTSTKQKNRETSFFDAPLITNSEADVMIEKAEKPVYNSVFTGVITNNQFLSTSKPEASAKFEILSSEVTPKSKPLHIKIPTTPKQDSGSSKQIGSPKFRQSP